MRVRVRVIVVQPPGKMLRENFADFVALQRAGLLQFWWDWVPVFIHAALYLYPSQSALPSHKKRERQNVDETHKIQLPPDLLLKLFIFLLTTRKLASLAPEVRTVDLVSMATVCRPTAAGGPATSARIDAAVRRASGGVETLMDELLSERDGGSLGRGSVDEWRWRVGVAAVCNVASSVLLFFFFVVVLVIIILILLIVVVIFFTFLKFVRLRVRG